MTLWYLLVYFLSPTVWLVCVSGLTFVLNYAWHYVVQSPDLRCVIPVSYFAVTELAYINLG